VGKVRGGGGREGGGGGWGGRGEGAGWGWGGGGGGGGLGGGPGGGGKHLGVGPWGLAGGELVYLHGAVGFGHDIGVTWTRGFPFWLFRFYMLLDAWAHPNKFDIPLSESISKSCGTPEPLELFVEHVYHTGLR